MRHSAKYLRRITSPEWAAFRRLTVMARGFTCERCGLCKPETFAGFQLHHKTYDRLGFEWAGDVQVLCLKCHELADRERAQETAARCVCRSCACGGS